MSSGRRRTGSTCSAARSTHPDLGELSRAFGPAYHGADALKDLAIVKSAASGDGGPMLVHVQIAPNSASHLFGDHSSVEKVAGWGGGE